MRPAAASLPDNVLRWIALSVVLAAAPHVPGLPLWITVLIAAALALRLGLRRPPGRWLLVPTVVLSLGAVLFQYRSLSGTDAGGAFFAAMVALKFLESRDRRDAGLMICLTYFLATSIFLTDQSIAMAGWVLFSVFVTTITLITHAAPDGPPLALRAQRAGLLLVQALPIMLVLFLLFPRISGPLWGLQQDPATAYSGLDDTMSPGSISNLLISDDVAFRVQFDAEIPPRAQRYWRGPVLWEFDGNTWSIGETRSGKTPAITTAGDSIDYSIILEPHGRQWVLALDLPLDDSARTKLTPGHNLVTKDPINSVSQYDLRSARSYRLETSLPTQRRRRALELPSGAAPRARALAAEWTDSTADPNAIVDRALTLFREQPFYYTLNPPRLTGDSVDQFLFGSREGFCEHYAGAFVFLMRAAGIPARVVTGYQGGEINALGKYLIVRQSDAHAWAEIWLRDRGWVRIDPTNAVSPQRIQLGIANVAGADERLGGLSQLGGGVWREIALAWDSVNHSWNRLVVNYGPELQQRLLRNLGLADLGRYTLGLLTVVIAGITLAGVWLLGLRLRPHRDPVIREWQRVRARLRRQGFSTPPTEAATHLAKRVAASRPELAPAMGRIARLYNALRYQRRARTGDLERLQREARRFRPGRRGSQSPPETASTRDSDSSNR